MRSAVTKNPIGIIAEDNSDIETISMLISKISKTRRKIKPFVGKGCGKLKRKCNTWANVLKDRGCSTLLVVHDSDSNDPESLFQSLKSSLDPCPIANHLICIPVQELEAWLLSDSDAIMKAFNLKKRPKSIAHPESIDSPKEHLEGIVEKASNGEKMYIHTKHNVKIAEHISIASILKSCSSFGCFHEFASAL